MMNKMRLSKFLKNSLNITKSELYKLFEEHNVTVNGIKTNLSYIIKDDDVICVDGNKLEYSLNEQCEINYVYYLYHKPCGVVCTNDIKVKNSYLNYLNLPQRVFCVGRLDKNSSGLLILTNNGNLFHDLLNPQTHVEKEYIVKTKRKIDDNFINNIQKSVIINGKATKPCQAFLIDNYTFKIILTEGMYHQIRIMVKMQKNEVVNLHRIRIGNIHIDDLKEGEIIKIDNI